MYPFQSSGRGSGGRGGAGRGGRGGGGSGFGDSFSQDQGGQQQQSQEDSPSYREDTRNLSLSRGGGIGRVIGRPRPGALIQGGYGSRQPAEDPYQGQERIGLLASYPVPTVPRGGVSHGDPSAPQQAGPGRGRGGLQPQAQQPPQYEPPPQQARQEVLPQVPAPGNVGTSQGQDVMHSELMRSELIKLSRRVSDAFKGFANAMENTGPTEYPKKFEDRDPDEYW